MVSETLMKIKRIHSYRKNSRKIDQELSWLIMTSQRIVNCKIKEPL